MKQYGWLKAIYMSFYSRSLYRDVAQNWGLGTFFYLFFLLAICWIALMFHIQPVINLEATKLINEITPQLPETMIIKEGTVITPENRPYIIQGKETNEIVAIVDTSGKYNTLDDVKTPVLITKNKVLYSDNNNAVRIYTIPATLTTDIVTTKVKDFILKVIGWLWVIIFPVVLVSSFLYRIFQSLFYAIIGKIFAVSATIKLTYVEIVKLTMVAITPVIVISTILEWFGLWFDYSGLFFVLAMCYLIFAIGANKDKAN